MKKILTTIILLTLVPLFTHADTTLTAKLSGKILIQTENHGEAWYINPGDNKRYFLGRPQDAFGIMKKLGIGISNIDLNKIKPHINQEQNDSDNDGYKDGEEIKNNYNPFGAGKLSINKVFTDKNLGKIFIQTEQNGEAWYINPNNSERYFLNTPNDAFLIMKNLGLGITNKDIDTIPKGILYNEIKNPSTLPDVEDPFIKEENNDPITNAADAIRSGNKAEAVKYFTPEMKKAIEYTIDFLKSEGRLTLGNILSGSKLENSTETKKTYLNEVYFNGEKIPVRFYVEKINGQWLMTNL